MSDGATSCVSHIPVAALASVGVLGALTAAPAAAYRTFEHDPHVGYPAAWARLPVQWELSLEGSDAVGLTAASLEASAIAAFATWESVECMAVTAALTGTSAGAPAAGDGRSTIGLVTSGWAERGFPDRPAFTDVTLHRRSNGRVIIVEADVYLDASSYRFVDGPASGGELDLQAVLTHELGHALGLLHPCGDPGAPACDAAFEANVMHPEYRGGRALGPDDIAGVCAVYGAAIPCDPACPDDRECWMGSCVDPACGAQTCEHPCEEGEAGCGAGRCDVTGACEAGACAVAGPNEGFCAREGTTGTPCGRGSGCESGLCLTSGETSYCTHACTDDADCGGLQRCAEVDARSVCAPLPPGGGCTVSVRSVRPASPLALLALFCWLARRKVRR